MTRSQLTAPSYALPSMQVSRTLSGFAQLARTWRQRTAGRRALKGLDAHLLADVGLTQSQAERETAKRFWQA